MEKELDRDEYVLADFGYIWVGSAKRNQGIPWMFGQVNNSFHLFKNKIINGPISFKYPQKACNYALLLIIFC